MIAVIFVAILQAILSIFCFHYFGLWLYSARSGFHFRLTVNSLVLKLGSVFLSASSKPLCTSCLPLSLSPFPPFFSPLSPLLSVLCLLLHYHHSPSVALWGETQPSVLPSITPSLPILHSLTSKMTRTGGDKDLVPFCFISLTHSLCIFEDFFFSFLVFILPIYVFSSSTSVSPFFLFGMNMS